MDISAKRLTKILASIVLPTIVGYLLYFNWNFESDIAIFWAVVTLVLVLVFVIPISRKSKNPQPVMQANSGDATSEVEIQELEGDELEEPSSWSGAVVLTLSLLVLYINISSPISYLQNIRSSSPDTGVFIFYPLFDGLFMLIMLVLTVISLRLGSSKYLFFSWIVAILSTVLGFLSVYLIK